MTRISILAVSLALAASAGAQASTPAVKVHLAKDVVSYAPNPEYPLGALLRHTTGSGVFIMCVNIKSGRVRAAIVAQTTDDRALDAAAVKAFIRWRFKPNAFFHRDAPSVHLTPPLTKEEFLVKVPVTFAMYSR